MVAPIFRFNEQRKDLVEAVVRRVVSETKDPMLALNDTAYHEISRLETARPPERDQIGYYRKLARGLGGMDASALRDKLTEVVRYHAEDVNGNFDPTVYSLSTHVMPAAMSVFLSPKVVTEESPLAILRGEVMARRVLTAGPTDRIRKLAALADATVIYVPTHLSNLDSPVFGYALQRADLPPVTYGAGKNLFTNPVLSFFMRNLGAYRIDRRLRHLLYKQVLKTYSSLVIERGFHSLFFPGGTRSRSGAVEQKLKLGLAGTGLEAFIRTTRAGATRRVYFVPATINYMLTLEAETLIDDSLKEQGKARYIIDDDESTRLGRMATFVRKLAQREESCVVRFCNPVDPFGNEVDDRGDSYDARGHRVDPRSYVMRGGVAVMDAARDAEYTRELGEAISEAYVRETVVMPTHVVAAAAFEHLVATSQGRDLFSMVRRVDALVPAEALERAVEQKCARLRDLAARGEIRLSKSVESDSPGGLVRAAVTAWNGYHSGAVMEQASEHWVLSDPKVLLYYQNRLLAHGLAYGGGAR